MKQPRPIQVIKLEKYNTAVIIDTRDFNKISDFTSESILSKAIMLNHISKADSLQEIADRWNVMATGDLDYYFPSVQI